MFSVAQKHRMTLFVRAIGMARAQVKIGMANLAYNSTRLMWFSTRTVPASFHRVHQEQHPPHKPMLRQCQQQHATA